jgi:hypothetical protein
MLFIPLFITLYIKLDPVTHKNAFSFYLKTGCHRHPARLMRSTSYGTAAARKGPGASCTAPRALCTPPGWLRHELRVNAHTKHHFLSSTFDPSGQLLHNSYDVCFAASS